jgi:pyruvate/2-oxoglutarate dehydrogenase complex dihydrolipoamide acyltransferase (E2) component
LVEVLVGAAVVHVSAPASGRLKSIERHEDDIVEPGGLLGTLAIPGPDLDADADPGLSRDSI